MVMVWVLLVARAPGSQLPLNIRAHSSRCNRRCACTPLLPIFEFRPEASEFEFRLFGFDLVRLGSAVPARRGGAETPDLWFILRNEGFRWPAPIWNLMARLGSAVPARRGVAETPDLWFILRNEGFR